jgi:hypothetical protein
MLQNVTGNLSRSPGVGQIVPTSKANEDRKTLLVIGAKSLIFTALNVGNQERVFWADFCP